MTTTAPTTISNPLLEEHQNAALTKLVTECDVPLIEDNLHSYLEQKIVSDEDDEFDQARFVLDLSVFTKQFIKWKSLLPRVAPHYAIKCNTNPMILKALHALGAGFDCASKFEIQQVLELGATTDKIIFANPCKQVSQINFARQVGVKLMTFDSQEELEKIHSRFPDAELVLRIRPDDSRSSCPFGSKFGADTADENIQELIQTAKELNLNVIGIAFHVGSGCFDSSAYKDAVSLAKECWVKWEEAGFSLSLLDIGGGFPGHLKDSLQEGELSFSQIAATLNEALDLHFPPKEGVRIISEPGRYFAMSSQVLACNLYSCRKNTRAKPGTSEPEYLYYINDGAYGAFNNTVFDHARPRPHILHEPSPPAEGERPLVRCKIFGPTCDSLDLVCPEALLPVLKPGTWLYFSDMGAYTTAASSNFNGFKTNVVHVVYSLCE